MSSVVTFYSFKGGVGRTMALANIAVLLAEQNQRVLMVDWDLEAPGLDRYFTDYTQRESAAGGLLELLGAAIESTAMPPWRDYVTEFEFGGRSLSLMTAGRQDVTYARRVLDLNWRDFFEQHNGGAFIESLRDDWRAAYDFVLIDSRTGYSDAGGVCLIQLPDIVVPLFTCTEQSLGGAKNVISRAQAGRQHLAYDRMPFLVLPVASRFDGRSEFEVSQYWLDHFAEELVEFCAPWLPVKGRRQDDIALTRAFIEKTKLPYIAYFSFGEKLPVLDTSKDDPEGLGFAYRSVAALIHSELRNVERFLGVDIAAATLDKPFFVPRPRDPFFVGRDALLSEVHSRLTEGGLHGYRTAVDLYGLGGIGKTSVALEYVYRYRDSYDAVFWVDASSNESMGRDLDAIAMKLPAEAHILGVGRDRAVGWLANNRNWLVVLDGWYDSDLAPFLREPTAHVIVTSRIRARDSELLPIVVAPFSREDVVQLMLQRTGRTELDQQEETAAMALAEQMEGHPLALSLAASYISSRDVSIASYLESFRRRSWRLLSAGDSGITLTHVLEETLTEFGPASKQTEILNFSAMLGDAPIPIEILHAEATKRGWISAEDGQLECIDLLHPLIERSLVSVEKSSYSVQRLLLSFVRSKVSQSELTVAGERVIVAVSAVTPEATYPWDDWERILPHAKAAASLISGRLEAHDRAASDSMAAFTLLRRLGAYLAARERYAEARRILSLNVTLSKEAPEAAIWRTIRSEAVAELVLLAVKRGWRKDADEAMAGSADPPLQSEAAALVLFSNAMYQAAFRDLTAARNLLERAKVISETAAPQSVLAAGILDELSRVYAEFNLLNEAERFANTAMTLRTMLLSPYDPAIAESFRTLAMIQLKGGSSRAALKFLENADLYTDKEQAGSIARARTLRLKAVAFMQLSEAQRGEALLQDALALETAVVGEIDPEVAETLQVLTRAQYAQGRLVDAEATARRALAIAREVYGPDGPRLSSFLVSLGDTLGALGDRAAAIKALDESVAIRQLLVDEERLTEGSTEIERRSL